ncbi:MAG: hypothetical protein ABL973_02120 [Micropepsaceae bacterium]
MSTGHSKAEELIALTTRLAALIEDDVTTLKGKRPAMLAKNEADRATAMPLYGKATADFRSPTAISVLPPATQTRLKTATARLHAAIKEQTRLLIRFRHVTEGLVKAVADVVAARETPTAYAKSGAFARSNASQRATAMTLNQAV